MIYTYHLQGGPKNGPFLCASNYSML